MLPVSISPAGQTPAAVVPAKLLHAAQQFEALLLNDLLGPVEKTFSSIPGKEAAAGSDAYQHLGTQALASHLAASGGFGIAAMIVRNIMKHPEIASQPEASGGTKVPLGTSR